MGSNWTITLLMLAIFNPASPTAWAGEGSITTTRHELATQSGCHYLLMEHECKALRQALANLPAGVERERLLAELRDTIREREEACRPLPQRVTIPQPRYQQAPGTHIAALPQ